MRVPFIDLKTQYREVKDAVDASFEEILSSGAYVLGRFGKELEESLAAKHGVKHGIAVNSGTDALRIMLQAGGVRPGDEVIVPAFTFVATIEVIVQLGAVPVFADIDSDTFCLDPKSIESKITKKTSAILPVHLYGQLGPVEDYNRIAEAHGLAVYEDGAQVVLAHHNGRHTGKWGVASGLSFYVTKNLGAAGDGGMILTDDDEVARRSRSLRIHGMGRERYYYDEIGYTSRMAELQAAFLVAKLAKLEAWNRRRAEIATAYLSSLAGTGIDLPVTIPGNHHTWHQFSIRTRGRDALAVHLRERETDTAIYYPVPLHLHEPYQEFGGGKGSLPVTEKVSEEVLCLPVHQHMSDEQVSWVVEGVRSFATAAV